METKETKEKSWIETFNEKSEDYLEAGSNILGFVKNVKDSFVNETKDFQENMYDQTSEEGFFNLGAVKNGFSEVKDQNNTNLILILGFALIAFVSLIVGVFK